MDEEARDPCEHWAWEREPQATDPAFPLGKEDLDGWPAMKHSPWVDLPVLDLKM
jgi:hypothetical protein